MPRDVTERDDDSVVTRALRALTQAVTRRPWVTLLLVAISAGLCGAYSLGSLKFKTERADLIDPDADYQKRWTAYTEGFGSAADMVVVAEATDAIHIKDALDDLGTRLAREPELFSDVLYKVDPSGLEKKGLQYLSPAELEALLTRLEEFGPVLRGQWNLFSLKTLYQGLRYQIARAGKAPEPAAAAAPLLHMAAGLSRSLVKFAENRRNYESPWSDLIAVDAPAAKMLSQTRYFLNEPGTMGFLLTRPQHASGGFEGATEAVDRMRVLLRETHAAHPHVDFGLTGIPVLECDEMRSSQSAMIWESIVSYLGVGLLLVLGFRGFKHPVLAMMMLAVGMAWCFGFATVAVGHLNILSVSFVAIVVGLGIDYAILYVSRYLEVRQQGVDLHPALQQTSRNVGPSILTAAATTSLAFFCAVFTDFLGVAELGLIAGGGILLCAVAALTFMPALITLADRKTEAAKMPTPFQGKVLRQFIGRYPGMVVAASLLVIAAVGSFGFGVKYDYNLLNLQAQGMESVEIQKRIVEKSDDRLLYAVSIADTPAEALALKKKFEALPTVRRVDEIASMLPKHPPEQTELLVQGVQVLLSHLPDVVPRPREIDPALIGKRMEELQTVLAEIGGPQAQQVSATLDSFLDRFDQLSLEQQMAFLTDYQYRMTADLLGRMRGLAKVADAEPVGVKDLPPALATRFVSTHGNHPGKWLLQIHPKDEIWDIDPLRKFVADVRSVDADVTGTPLQNFEASQQIRRSYETVAVYALLASYLVLLIDFLSFRHTLLALLGPLAGVLALAFGTHALGNEMELYQLALAYILMTLTLVGVLDFQGFSNIFLALLPPLAGAALTMGILGLLHVDLNPANLIILPLILGIGVDNGVHVLHDYRLQSRNYRPSPSLVNALFLTSFSNMAGFASMILAAHRGLKSIGLVLTIGVGSCLFVSVVLLPAILTLCSSSRRSADEEESDEPEEAAEEFQRPVGLSVFYPPESAA